MYLNSQKTNIILGKVSCLSIISIIKAGLALDPSPVPVVRLLFLLYC